MQTKSMNQQKKRQKAKDLKSVNYVGKKNIFTLFDYVE